MGRKRIEITLPEGRFTTIDLQSQNPRVSAFVIHGRLREWIAEGKVRRVGVCPTKPGAGKAAYLYASEDRRRSAARRDRPRPARE